MTGADDERFGLWDGRCAACDAYGRVDDTSLCESCSGMLERDLIRQRDWDYSAVAFGLSDEGRERLRAEVIRDYGEALELIAPGPGSREGRGRKRRRKRRKKRG